MKLDEGAGTVNYQKMRNASDTYYYFADGEDPTASTQEKKAQRGLIYQNKSYMKSEEFFTTNYLERGVIYTDGSGNAPKFLARNPGKWSEGSCCCRNRQGC